MRAEQPAVLLISTERLGPELPAAAAKKFALMLGVAPHVVIAYTKRRTFQHRRATADTPEMFLVPDAYPVLVRVALYWLVGFTAACFAVARRNVRILVSQTPYDGVLFAAVRSAARLAGRRCALVVQIQGDWEEVLPLVHPMARRLAPLWKPPLRRVVRTADVVRAVSAATAAIAERHGARRVITFATFSDLDAFLEPVMPPAPHQPPRVCFGGVLTRVKGVDVLLDAAHRLATRGRPVELVIAGAGPERESLEKLAVDLGVQDAVRWEGHVDAPRLRSLIDDSAVFVLPSRTEGLPRVILEAMARARTVVASRVGGIPDVIVDGDTGLLFPADDAAALADCIERAITDDAFAARLGANARRAIEDGFGSARYAAKYRELVAAATAARAS